MISPKKHVLICGHRSFAARGLAELLRSNGHRVTEFSRGPVACNGNVVTGPAVRIANNKFLDDKFDVVINYILLLGEQSADNERYLMSLLEMCERLSVGHLVHMSSVSVYKAGATAIDEHTEIEPDPNRKGPYGSIKVRQDLCLLNRTNRDIRVSFIRPGFILGPGLVNPLVGIGTRTPWNRLLLIGAPYCRMPLTSRDRLNEALGSLVATPPADSTEVLLVVDQNSPTRRDYLDGCCSVLGAGLGTIALPKAAWFFVGCCAAIGLPVLGRRNSGVLRKILSVCTDTSYETSLSQQRLGINFAFDWREHLRCAVDGQMSGIVRPAVVCDDIELSASKRVGYLGVGRIVRQKHLPALTKLGVSGLIRGHDVNAAEIGPCANVSMVPAEDLKDAGLVVVATPGPVHAEAVDVVQGWGGDILVEKPLCYSEEELSRWLALDGEADRRVFVCHNYRYKRNVLQMFDHLDRHNPGILRSVSVVVQSPSVREDGAAWLRREREARTLLMDYSLHFLDLACMFDTTTWNLESVSHDLNDLGDTSCIEGRVSSTTYPVTFTLRQGFVPRRYQVIYCFQNYTVSLQFFPDTFAVDMSDGYAWVVRAESRQIGRQFRAKVIDRLMGRDSDESHVSIYRIAMSPPEVKEADSIRVGGVAEFYRLMFRLSEAVYG